MALRRASFISLTLGSSGTGYTKRGVETKIHRHVWAEGKEYRRAPDGCIFIDMEGFEKWVQSQMRPEYAQTATA